MTITDKLSSLERRTLLALHKCAGRGQFCTVPLAVIAQEAKAPERSIREALRMLELLGLVIRHFAPGKQSTYELLSAK